MSATQSPLTITYTGDPVAVDPDLTLEAYALGRGWPIMSLR